MLPLLVVLQSVVENITEAVKAQGERTGKMVQSSVEKVCRTVDQLEQEVDRLTKEESLCAPALAAAADELRSALADGGPLSKLEGLTEDGRVTPDQLEVPLHNLNEALASVFHSLDYRTALSLPQAEEIHLERHDEGHAQRAEELDELARSQAEELAGLKQTQSSLEGRLRAEIKEKANLQDELKNTAQRVTDLEGQLQTREQELLQWNLAHESSKHEASVQKYLRAQCEQKQTQLNERVQSQQRDFKEQEKLLKGQVVALEGQIVLLTEEHERLRQIEVDQVAAEQLQTCEARRKALADELQQLKDGRVSLLSNRVQALEQESAELQKLQAERVEALEQDNAELHKQLRRAEDELATIQLDEAHTQFAHCTEELEQHKKDIERLNAELEEAETLHAERVRALEQESDVLKEEVQGLHAELDESEALLDKGSDTLSALRTQLEGHKKALAETTERYNQAEAWLSGQLEEVTAKDIPSKLEVFREAYRVRAGLEERNNDLQRQLQEQAQVCQQAYTELEEELEQCKRQLQGEPQQDDTQRELEGCRKAYQEASGEVGRLETELSTAKQDHNGLRVWLSEQLKEVTPPNGDIKTGVSTLQKRYQEALGELQGCKEALAAAEKRYYDEEKAWLSKLQDQAQILQNWEAAYGELKGKFEQCEDQLQEQPQQDFSEVQQLREALEEARGHLSVLGRENQKLEGQYGELLKLSQAELGKDASSQEQNRLAGALQKLTDKDLANQITQLFKESRRNLTRAVGSLRTNVDKYKSQVKELEGKVAELGNQLDEMTELVHSGLQGLNIDTAPHGNLIGTMPRFRKHSSDAQEYVTGLKQRIDLLENQLRPLEVELENCKTAVPQQVVGAKRRNISGPAHPVDEQYVEDLQTQREQFQRERDACREKLRQRTRGQPTRDKP